MHVTVPILFNRNRKLSTDRRTYWLRLAPQPCLDIDAALGDRQLPQDGLDQGALNTGDNMISYPHVGPPGYWHSWSYSAIICYIDIHITLRCSTIVLYKT